MKQAERIAELEKQVADLKAQLELLSLQIGALQPVSPYMPPSYPPHREPYRPWTWSDYTTSLNGFGGHAFQ